MWEKDFEKRTKATLQWLEQSIKATDYQGSAACFHLWRGWSAAYPETTGYIIETLFNYAAYYNKKQYKDLAISCADWLCTLQRADGAFPGGIGMKGEPVVFDTGQILFGLTRAYKETEDIKYHQALVKAVHWLLQILEADGSWQRFAYINNYIPAYYTRVVWAILHTNNILKNNTIIQKMRQALDFYIEHVNSNKSVKNWGFREGEAAFTHTIAYTIRGFLESAYLLQEEQYIITAQQIVNKVLELHHKNGKIAGRYDENWQGDYTFECVTGNAQLTIVLARLYQITNEINYKNDANHIFQRTFSQQWLVSNNNLYGAVPGSMPIWGAYQRFTFPNWAAKFYLDAYLITHQIFS